MAKLKKVISEGLNATKPRPAARMTDTIGHGPPSGAIMFGAPTVIIGGQIAARMGDPVECKVHGPGGNIQLGSMRVLIAGSLAARMGDPTQCCAPGVAGTGSPPVVGAPGSFSEDYEGMGPDHKMSGYKNEDGEQRQDEFRLWGHKETHEGGGFKYEKEQTLFSGKSEGHQGNYKNQGGGVQGNAFVDKRTITAPDGSSITRTSSGGNVQGGVDMLMGSDGRRTGLNYGLSGQASAIEDQYDYKDEIRIPGTDWSLQRNSTLGGSAGSMGLALNAGAYHDAADDRYHVNLMTDVEAILGVKIGLDISIGKSSSAGGGGSGTPGAGAVGTAGAITSGCMTVLIGG
jgi:uncharacterized Zn-binding protein involved in type VI secretion